MTEIAILATDIAEVLGGALAIKLLVGLPLWAGILLTAFDMLLVGLKERGFRQVEAIVTALVATIALCFAIELWIVPPDLAARAIGPVPDMDRLARPSALAVAIGIVGATVMPHNLYLHSSIVQTRKIDETHVARRRAIRMANWDSGLSLLLAALVNGAILALAAGALHLSGHGPVTEIDEAYRLLSSIRRQGGSAVLRHRAARFWAEQHLHRHDCGAGRARGVSRSQNPLLAAADHHTHHRDRPALVGVLWMGDHGVGPMPIVSQIILSLQLPFAIWPLIRTAGDREIMGDLATRPAMQRRGWLLFGLVSAANLWLLVTIVA